MIAALVRNNADVNARNNDKKTPCDLVKEDGKIDINIPYHSAFK